MFELSIPQVSKEEILKRYKTIKPVINNNGRLKYFREFSDDEVFRMSLFWDIEDNLGESAKDLANYNRDFYCLHSYEHHCLFKPTIAEILAQIDPAYIPFVHAFEIYYYPKTMGQVFDDWFSDMAFNQGYFVSVVRLFS